jgi:hypothetical protein
MSIRQIRLNSSEQIKSKIGEFKGERIHIVLSNKTAETGKLISVEAEAVILENGRKKKNRFLFREITELYFDQKV